MSVESVKAKTAEVLNSLTERELRNCFEHWQHRLQLCVNSKGNYEGRTESHEQLFLHANWEQQTKESEVVDGTSCCVILECFVTSIACIT